MRKIKDQGRLHTIINLDRKVDSSITTENFVMMLKLGMILSKRVDFDIMLKRAEMARREIRDAGLSRRNMRMRQAVERTGYLWHLRPEARCAFVVSINDFDTYQIFKLRYIDHYTWEEVANEIGLTDESSSSDLHNLQTHTF